MVELKKVLSDMVKCIVDQPDEVTVLEESAEDSKNVTLTLTVAQSDMGKVIGKHGRIARSIRLVMKTAGARIGKRVNVEIKD